MHRGYHVYNYQDTWLATDGETLDCVKELYNRSDSFSVAVKKDIEVVRHVPRDYSRAFSLFLWNDGYTSCCVNESRRYSRDLPQGELEIPCINRYENE